MTYYREYIMKTLQELLERLCLGQIIYSFEFL